MKYGKLRPQGKVIDHWQLLHESDFEDTDTKLLLHLDNEVTDWATGKTVTNTNVTFSSTVWKFNSYSGIFNGTNAYLSISDSNDWAFGTGDFTIDLWFNAISLQATPNETALFSQVQDYAPGNYFVFFVRTTNYTFRVVSGGVTLLDWTVNAANSTGVWYHISLVRNGNSWTVYRNGLSIGTTTASITMPDLSAPFAIGDQPANAKWFNGYIDEFRIVKGTSKWTSNFTPPTAPYLGRTTTYPITTDRNTVLMISGEGVDGSTSVIDETGKAVTCNGNAQIDTAQFKFGQSSVLFDGTGDYLSLADSPDWDFGEQPFTIDLWVRFNSVATTSLLLSSGYINAPITNTSWFFQYSQPAAFDGLAFTYSTDGTGATLNTLFVQWTPSTGTWYHLAVVRNGVDLKFFVNGTQQGATQNIGTANLFPSTRVLRIGAAEGSSGAENPLNGWLDDIRISKGIARWTSNFTPPLKTTALINGDTDEEYRLVSEIKSTAVNQAVYLKLNNDAGSNYGNQQVYGSSTTISATRNTGNALGFLVGSDDSSGTNDNLSELFLYAKSGYVRTVIDTRCLEVAGTSVGVSAIKGQVWNNTTAPVAALQLYQSVANGTGCGTKFILYRKVQ